MNRYLGWTSLSLALLAPLAGWALPGRAAFVLVPATLSLLLGAVELLVDLRRVLLVLSFAPAFVLALAVHTFDGPAAGLAALAAVSLGFQLRLFFLRRAAEGGARNARFAADLEEHLPARVSVFIDVDIASEVERSAVHEGHLLRVSPGDVLATDGQVTYGSSFVDESPLGGEKEPATKGMGSFVFAGSLNRNGSFLFRATGGFAQSHLARLAQALRRGAPFEDLFAPSLFALEAALAAAAVAVFLLNPSGLIPLLNVFLAAGSAGLAAAAWARNESVVARAAAEGGVFRDRPALARIGAAEAVVAGAPGVLTEGRARLDAVEGTPLTGEDAALRLLGPLARRIENEAAFAVLRELQVRNIPLELLEVFTPTPGGAAGLVAGEDVRWIDLDTARVENVPMASLEAFAREQARAGHSVVLLLRDGRAAAALAFADRVHPHAREGLALLRRESLPFLLVTPESEENNKHLRDDLDLAHVHADAGPAETTALAGRMTSEGLPPLLVASPALRSAGPGVAVVASAALGPETAGAADAALLRADLRGVARLFLLARHFRGEERSAFRIALAAQLALTGLGFFLDPRLAALLAGLPAWLLVARAERVSEHRFGSSS